MGTPLPIAEGKEGAVVVQVRLPGRPVSISAATSVCPGPVAARVYETEPDEIDAGDI